MKFAKTLRDSRTSFVSLRILIIEEASFKAANKGVKSMHIVNSNEIYGITFNHPLAR